MTITGQSSLNKDDIQRMIRDAETHAEEDRRRRDEAETRNQADTLVYQTERMLRDYAEKIGPDEKDKINDALGKVKSALNGTDIGEIRQAHEQLMFATQTFAQKLYEQTGSTDGGPSGSDFGTPSDDDVVDAEIVDG